MRNSILIAICLLMIACSRTPKVVRPIVAPSMIVKDMMGWLYYDRDHMNWTADFTALDTMARTIGKGEFLRLLTKGNYLPLQIETSDSTLCYQLYRIDKSTDKEIIDAVQQRALSEYQFFNMEGMELPKFNFTDINGTNYSAETLKGKTVVINCWFIHCRPCVAEIPELSQLVKRYAANPNIVFIALAFDKADQLKTFLKKNSFSYKVIPNMEDYLVNDLNISGYPTNLVVDKNGKILKVIHTNVQDLEEFLATSIQAG